MTFQSSDVKCLLSEEESELYEALTYFASSMMSLDKSPTSLARAALVFSATCFAGYGCLEDFKDRSDDLYITLKFNLSEMRRD